MTDTQRSQVYGAERLLCSMLERGGPVEIAGSTLTLPVERRFGNLDNVRDYVRRVHQVFGGGRPVPPVRVRRGHTRAHYEPRSNTLAIPETTWALREEVVLHEYAHYLVTVFDGLGHESHGQAFQDRLVSLLTEVIGPEAGFVFRVLVTS